MLRPNLFQLTVFIASLCVSSCGAPNQSGAKNERKTSTNITALLESAAKQELAYLPETASQLGISAEVAGYSFFADINDRSDAGIARIALQRIETLAKLEDVEVDELPTDLATSLLTVRTAYRNVVDMQAFGHGQVSLGFVRPYALDQLSGGYIDVPDLLLNRQPTRVMDEALFYIERLAGLAGAIDDERRKLEADERRGIAPPSFILERMQLLAIALADGDAPVHPLVRTLENQMIGLPDISDSQREQISNQARRIVSTEIIPAYDRLSETLADMQTRASDVPGIWQLEHGEEYYAAVLNFYSGRSASPAEIHDEGLQLVEQLTARLERALQDQGFIEGTITERLTQIGEMPDQQYPNTEEGRQALLDRLSNQMLAMQSRTIDFIDTPPATSVSVMQVPDFLAPTAPGGYYIAAPADGAAPALFFINLRDTREWPAFTLPTLLYHETWPGHHLESALVAEQVSLPLIRQMIWNPTFGEGWAVYAEDLAYEFGAYSDDPMGELGYLQSLLFRAARLVTDTGLHYDRWSRQRAIDYLVATTGQPASAMATEVDRYTVWPGQATSYMSGRQTLRALREKAQIILGDNFSLKSFHAVILGDGPRPMSIVEQDVEAWIIDTLG